MNPTNSTKPQEWLLEKIYNIVKKADDKEHDPQNEFSGAREPFTRAVSGLLIRVKAGGRRSQVKRVFRLIGVGTSGSALIFGAWEKAWSSMFMCG